MSGVAVLNWKRAFTTALGWRPSIELIDLIVRSGSTGEMIEGGRDEPPLRKSGARPVAEVGFGTVSSKAFGGVLAELKKVSTPASARMAMGTSLLNTACVTGTSCAVVCPVVGSTVRMT